MPKRTKKTTAKPAKPPYEKFPLFQHQTGYWAKKIRGKTHYFGKVADGWQAALDIYNEQRDDLHAGRTPRSERDGLTVADLLNRFLTSKEMLRDNGEITPRTFADYKATGDRLVAAFDKRRLVTDLAADDFERLRASIAKNWGPVALGNEIQRIRSVFKYGYDAGLIDQPMRFGPGFKRPNKKVLRKARNSGETKMFEAAELQQILNAATMPLKAMILLGINCGYGNSDCATLPQKAVDLKAGWVNYPRPKTGIERRCPLWPETIAALREALKRRPKPKDKQHAELVFITKYGGPWGQGTNDRPITHEFTKVLDALGLRRKQLGFYTLRHVFATIGGGSKDQIAVNFLMGHSDESIAAHYRERIDDDRLIAVADHVRAWLFGKKQK